MQPQRNVVWPVQTAAKQWIHSAGLDEIETYLMTLKERPYRAKQIVDWLYQKRAGSFEDMSEPLANLANVVRSIRIINAPWGLEIGARHITVSTSGLAPQIKKLADEPLQSRLAISLHGATDEVRNRIMPVNRKYNLTTLLSACDYYTSKKKQ